MLTWVCAPATERVLAVNTEDAVQSEKPKRIVYVLEGGGALGFAHVGALKVLEKYNVCADALVGTSMGAIVGGLYASGYDAVELEKVATDIDWATLFDDRIPRQALSYRRKQDDASFLATGRVGVDKNGLRGSLGVIQGHTLMIQMRELLEDRAQVQHFDELPIPFRAVAVNLLNGKAEMLDQGNLVTAMRASMSIPGVFPPTEVKRGEESVLMVDGGLSQNLPVEFASEAFAPDHIVAIRLDTGIEVERADIRDAIGVLGQTVSIMIDQNVQRSLQKLEALKRENVSSTLIRIKIDDYSSASFDKAKELIKIGEEATETYAEELKQLANRSCRQSAPVSNPIISYIEIEDESGLDQRILLQRLGVELNKPLDKAQLREGLDAIYSIGIYDQVDYELVSSEDPEKGEVYGLRIMAKKQAKGLATLRFGLNLENNFDKQSAYNLAAELTFFALNSLGGESRTELVVGDDLRLLTEFFQPFQPSRSFFFARPRAGYDAIDVPLFVGEDKVAEFRVRFGAVGLDLGYQIDDLGEFTLTVTRGWGKADLKIGDPALEDQDIQVGEAIAAFDFDRLDDLGFPRDGFRLNGAYRRGLEDLGSLSGYGIIELGGTYVRSWDRHTVLTGFRGQYTAEGTAPIEAQALLGGLFNLSGLERRELSGQHSLLGLVSYYHRVNPSTISLLDMPIYLGVSGEVGQVYNDRESFRGFEDLTFAGSAFVGVDSPLGPLYLAYGHAEGGRQSVYLFLGRPF